jgi:antitoxin HicB
MASGHAPSWAFRKGTLGSAKYAPRYNRQDCLYNARRSDGLTAWIYQKNAKNPFARFGNRAKKSKRGLERMNMKKNKHIGSNFDDFLKEEGILEEIEEVVAKKIFVFQMEKEMKKQGIDKAELAERMETSRSAVDRILDPESPSTLRTFAKAARALGRHLKISLA